MKPDKRLSGVKPSEPRGFYDLAKAHVETHGGAWFVADKHETPQQWRAWVAYGAWLDGQTTPRGRKACNVGLSRKADGSVRMAAWIRRKRLAADVGGCPSPREEMPRPSAASSSPTCCVRLWPSTN